MTRFEKTYDSIWIIGHFASVTTNTTFLQTTLIWDVAEKGDYSIFLFTDIQVVTQDLPKSKTQ